MNVDKIRKRIKLIENGDNIYLPTNDSFIDSRYEAHNSTYGHYWYYYRTFYYLAKYIQPNLVVELGGYQGTAAAHFAAGCPKSTVITIDHHTDQGDDFNQVKMEKAAGVYPNLYYIQGWTTKILADREKGKHHFGDVGSAFPKVLETVDRIGHRIDILFIDSWHHYEEANWDWDVYSSLLASPSLVICDDIQPGRDIEAPISGMMKFWDELPGEKHLNGQIHPGTNMGFMIYE